MKSYDLNRQKLLAAIENDELIDFLQGSDIYSLGYNPYRPGNAMLDLEPSMYQIYKLHKENPDIKVSEKLEKTLYDWVMWQSGIGVFAVFQVLSYQLKMEKENKASFKLECSDLIELLNKQAITYEDKLKERKDYEGSNFTGGLWEAMLQDNEDNKTKFGINILNK